MSGRSNSGFVPSRPKCPKDLRAHKAVGGNKRNITAMDNQAQEWIAGVALLIAVIMIVAGMAMIFSRDIITKIEGIIAAPVLIGGGVAIIVALVRRK
jgi:hypothetical protein